VDEDSPEVVGILLHAVVERLDLFLVEKPQDTLLQLAGTLARDDLDESRLFGDRFVNDSAERAFDLVARL
jgi:hypothetical protein